MHLYKQQTTMLACLFALALTFSSPAFAQYFQRFLFKFRRIKIVLSFQIISQYHHAYYYKTSLITMPKLRIKDSQATLR